MMIMKIYRRFFNTSSLIRTEKPAAAIDINEIENAEDPNLQQIVLYYFHKAVSVLEPDLHKIVDEERFNLTPERRRFRVEGIINLISSCSFFTEITFPIKLDVCGYELITGFKSHHSMHRMPMLGGFMIHPSITGEDVMGLATLNTFKNAMISVPFGGSQGAIKICSSDLTENERQKVIRRYCLELLKKNIIGPGIDCGINDMNTGPREMFWLTDTYMKTFGSTDINATAITTGKPTFGGGIRGKLDSAGWGIFNLVDYLMQDTSLMGKINFDCSWKGKKVIVQGVGHVGYYAAKYFCQAGAILIGVIEKEVSILDETGLDIEDIGKYKHCKGGNLAGYTKGNQTSADTLLSHECDFLLLCACHKSITKCNAPNIKAKIIIEGADAAITPAADKILREKNVLIVPDICVGGGGVLSSYFEWLKSVRHMSFGRMSSGIISTDLPQLIELMNTNLKKSVSPNASILLSKEETQTVFHTSEKNIVKKNLAKNLRESGCWLLESSNHYNVGINLRLAAYCRSIYKVFKSYEAAGLTV